MLDRLFMSKMNKTGKILYFVGQFVLLGLIALVIFGVLGVDFEDGYIGFIIAVIASAVGWGVLCMVIWPAQKKTDTSATSPPEAGTDQKAGQ
jgi:hypothetical protein